MSIPHVIYLLSTPSGYSRCKCAHRPWSLKIRCPPTTFEVNACGKGVVTPETVCCQEMIDRDGDGTSAKGSEPPVQKDSWVYWLDRDIQGEKHPDYIKEQAVKKKLSSGDDFVGPKKPKSFLEIMRKQYYEDQERIHGKRKPQLPELPVPEKVHGKGWIHAMQKMHEQDQANIAENKRKELADQRNKRNWENVRNDDHTTKSKKKGWRKWLSKIRKGIRRERLVTLA